jgi:hypothetical protein
MEQLGSHWMEFREMLLLLGLLLLLLRRGGGNYLNVSVKFMRFFKQKKDKWHFT